MDLSVQAQRMLADLVENGGGTYVRRTLEPFAPSHGYAVGVGGVAIPACDCTADVIAWCAKGVAGEYMTDYVGTWLSNDVVYIDAVRHIEPGDLAIRLASDLGQQAIYDFATGESITFGGEDIATTPKES